ncbi:unnamed protein product [Paramecium sonneborni]|uniref:Uncharacterized protein n=1 Tax=Paramecium sonneborni TaxID=65129 RepID=A0A8S1MBW3_9CILI|nr:unnamed protein product [Paramecium sonneborni]
MNNGQASLNQLNFHTQSQNPALLQSLQEENMRLKQELQQTKETHIQTCLRLQNEKKEMGSKIQDLQIQVDQQNKELLVLRNSQKESQNNIEISQNLKDKCIELQFTNQELTLQLDQLRQNKQLVIIECKPEVSQQYKLEIVHLKFTQNMNNMQVEYQRKVKDIEFIGYGESQDQCFIFRCKCQLSQIPKEGQNPQIIQNNHEILIKFQI